MTHWNRIAERTVDDVVILDLLVEGASRLDMSGRLLSRIEQLIGDRHIKILINLSEVRHVDSDDFGELVRGFNAARQAGGRLAFYGVGARMRDLLVATKLDDYIPVFDSEHEAVRNLATSV